MLTTSKFLPLTKATEGVGNKTYSVLFAGRIYATPGPPEATRAILVTF